MWTSVFGGVLIGVIMLVALFFFIYFVYSWKERKKNAEKVRKIHHKYSVVECKSETSTPLNLKKNKIQPPYKEKVKVKIHISKEPSRKDKLEYDSEMEKELLLEDYNSQNYEAQEEHILEKGMSACKDTFAHFYDYFSQNQMKTIDSKLSMSSPNIIDIDDKSTLTVSRLPRADSVYEVKLGKLLFTMHYLHREEYAIIHLLSGRHITTGDELCTVSMAAISVLIEGQPESEVISSPDEVPNPEYDQEFAFPLIFNDIKNTTIRFVVWDIVSNHESSVIGFVRVPLINYERLLATNTDNETIEKEIKPSLGEPVPLLGELLISLLYDCVTDKINLIIKRGRWLDIQNNDTDLHFKVSLLLDNAVIQSKRSEAFTAERNVLIKQSFEFNSLSTDLDKLTEKSTNKNPTLPKLQERTLFRSKTIREGISKAPRETLRNNMGILFSLRSVTKNRSKRQLGNIYLGKTSQKITDSDFHWSEMVKNFDRYVTQWHQVKQETS